jgi:hypothetical protein
MLAPTTSRCWRGGCSAIGTARGLVPYARSLAHGSSPEPLTPCNLCAQCSGAFGQHVPPIRPGPGDPRLPYHLMVVLPAGSSFALQVPRNADCGATDWALAAWACGRFGFCLSACLLIRAAWRPTVLRRGVPREGGPGPECGWGAARHGGPPRVPSRQLTLAMPWSHTTHRPTLPT